MASSLLTFSSRVGGAPPLSDSASTHRARGDPRTVFKVLRGAFNKQQTDDGLWLQPAYDRSRTTSSTKAGDTKGDDADDTSSNGDNDPVGNQTLVFEKVLDSQVYDTACLLMERQDTDVIKEKAKTMGVPPEVMMRGGGSRTFLPSPTYKEDDLDDDAFLFTKTAWVE